MTAPTEVDSYTAAQAGKVLGVSPKRVHQLTEEDRLVVVGRDPLRVSQVSVLQLKKERESTVTDSEVAGRSPGASRRSPPTPTPSAELVPLLTSAFDRVQAADARTLEEHGQRMTAEAEARFLRDALHEARAGQTRAEQELTEVRGRLLHLEVVEAEVVRLRAELAGVRAEGESPLRPEPSAEPHVGGSEAPPSEVPQERARLLDQSDQALQRAETGLARGEQHLREGIAALRPTPPASRDGLLVRLFGRR